MNWGYGHKKKNIPEDMLDSETPKLVGAEFVRKVDNEVALTDMLKNRSSGSTRSFSRSALGVPRCLSA